MTALCSVTCVMMWLPFFLYIAAAPLMARLLLSVAPLVKMISLRGRVDQRCDLLARFLDGSLGFPAIMRGFGWLRCRIFP